jgi:hypothetical protein
MITLPGKQRREKRGEKDKAMNCFKKLFLGSLVGISLDRLFFSLGDPLQMPCQARQPDFLRRAFSLS